MLLRNPIFNLVLFAAVWPSSLAAQVPEASKPVHRHAGFQDLKAGAIIEIFASSPYKRDLAERFNKIRVYRYYPHDFLIEHISSRGVSKQYWLSGPTEQPKPVESVQSEDFNRMKIFNGHRYEFIGSEPRMEMDTTSSRKTRPWIM